MKNTIKKTFHLEGNEAVVMFKEARKYMCDVSKSEEFVDKLNGLMETYDANIDILDKAWIEYKDEVKRLEDEGKIVLPNFKLNPDTTTVIDLKYISGIRRSIVNLLKGEPIESHMETGEGDLVKFNLSDLFMPHYVTQIWLKQDVRRPIKTDAEDLEYKMEIQIVGPKKEVNKIIKDLGL